MLDEVKRNLFRKRFLKSGNVNEGLKEVLRYELHNKSKTDPSFGETDFFNYLYFDNDSFKKTRGNLTKEIELNNSKYFVIHGYAKTGKSTFFKHLQYISNGNLQSTAIRTIVFDIAADFSSEPGKLNTLKTVAIKQLLKPFLDSSYKKPRSIQKIRNFYNIIFDAEEVLQKLDEGFQIEQENNEDPEPSPLVNLLGYLPHQMSVKLSHLIDEINKTENDKNLNHEQRKSSIHTQIIDAGQNLQNFLDNNYKEEDSGKILCYLLFLKIIQNKMFFSDSSPKKKILFFIFDNIDDVLYDLAIAVSTNYAHSICVFLDALDELHRFYEGIIIGFKPSLNVKVAFVYRTANYANIYHTGLSMSSQERTPSWALLREAYNCKITTVKDAGEILDKRYNFYLSLLSEHEKNQLNPYLPALIKSLKLAEYQEENSGYLDTNVNDFRFMFRLSNGSRMPILSPTFYSYCDELNWGLYKDNNKFNFLKRGAFLHIFIKSLLSLQNDATRRSLNDILFSFFKNKRGDEYDKRCDLLRLLFGYIINSLSPESKRREIHDMKDMNRLGVSLYDILESICLIRKADGSPTYDRDEVIDLFDLLFDGEIDSFDYLLSHNKSAKREQILSNGNPPINVQGKYVSFSKDIDAFWKYKFDADPNENIIRIALATKNIKFFYNDNTYYIFNYVWTHFESISLALGNTAPLMFAIENKEYNSILRLVYNETQTLCTISVDHYISDFKKWPPIEYCNTSKFAYSERFYFAAIIPRHVTYIEDFRYYYLHSVRYFTDDVYRLQFNRNLIGHIEKYVDLFFLLYNKLINKFGEDDIPLKVSAVYNSFLTLKDKIVIIQNSRFSDFETKIQT